MSQDFSPKKIGGSSVKSKQIFFDVAAGRGNFDDGFDRSDYLGSEQNNRGNNQRRGRPGYSQSVDNINELERIKIPTKNSVDNFRTNSLNSNNSNKGRNQQYQRKNQNQQRNRQQQQQVQPQQPQQRNQQNRQQNKPQQQNIPDQQKQNVQPESPRMKGTQAWSFATSQLKESASSPSIANKTPNNNASPSNPQGVKEFTPKK